MAEIIGSPNRYAQGAGIIAELGTYTAKLGSKASVILDPFVEKNFLDVLTSSFENSSCTAEFVPFGGEASQREVDRIKGIAEEKGCDIIVGIGGGKAADTAKAVSHFAKLPCVVMPTIASTDAPCSSLSVIYTDDHKFDKYLYLPAGPDLVILDTAIIANAPARLLAAGMGDAMATYFEAQACADSHSENMLGGHVTIAAMALAEKCYETLLDEGLKAILAANVHAVTPALEHIVEANTYLSGIGFESGGLAAAHAIHNGLTVLPQTHELYHGEKVAFGTIAQLVMQNVDEEVLQTVVEFCITMGLPVTFAELGLENVTDEELMKVAEVACAPDDTAHHMPFPVTPETIYNALIGANAIGSYYSGAGDDGDCCGHEH